MQYIFVLSYSENVDVITMYDIACTLQRHLKVRYKEVI